MLRPCFAALLLAFLLAGCGEDDDGFRAGNPQVVFQGAMRAVHDGDWELLQRYLTRDARVALEADMRRLRTNLATPEPGSPLLRVVEVRLGDAWQAEVDTALSGGMPTMLRFFVKLSPREREPAPDRMQLDPRTNSAQIPYQLHDGDIKVVTLVEEGGRWYVSKLPL